MKNEQTEEIILDKKNNEIIENRKTALQTKFNISISNKSVNSISVDSSTQLTGKLSDHMPDQEIVEFKKNLMTSYFKDIGTKRILNIKNSKANQAFLTNYNSQISELNNEGKLNEHRHFDNIVSQLKNINISTLNHVQKRSYEKKMIYGSSKLTPALLFFINSTIAITTLGFLIYSFTERQKFIDWNKQFFNLLELEETIN